MPVGQYQTTATFTPPSQINLAQQINDLYFFPQSTPVTTSLTHELSSGNTGPSSWKNLGNYVYEPVNVMSGEFYEDKVDLTMAGPMPLQLRRNYSSQNQDDRNGFGYGWCINLVPYITTATNTALTATNVLLSAVELDGSVITYRQQAANSNLFLPLPLRQSATRQFRQRPHRLRLQSVQRENRLFHQRHQPGLHAHTGQRTESHVYHQFVPRRHADQHHFAPAALPCHLAGYPRQFLDFRLRH